MLILGKNITFLWTITWSKKGPKNSGNVRIQPFIFYWCLPLVTFRSYFEFTEYWAFSLPWECDWTQKLWNHKFKGEYIFSSSIFQFVKKNFKGEYIVSIFQFVQKLWQKTERAFLTSSNRQNKFSNYNHPRTILGDFFRSFSLRQFWFFNSKLVIAENSFNALL